MPTPREVAVDPFFAHSLLHAIDRGKRSGVHSSAQLRSIHRNQLVHAQFHAREHHAAIARTCTPAHSLGFQHRDFRAPFGQGARPRQPRETCANHRHIDTLRQRRGTIPRRHGSCRQPVVSFLQSLYLLGLQALHLSAASTAVVRDLSDLRLCFAIHHNTAVSGIIRPSAKRERFSTHASIKSVFPVSIKSLRIFPVAGACITPCPLNPFARKNPGTSGTSPRTG